MIIAYLLPTSPYAKFLSLLGIFSTAMPSVVWSVGNPQCFSKIALVVRLWTGANHHILKWKAVLIFTNIVHFYNYTRDGSSAHREAAKRV